MYPHDFLQKKRRLEDIVEPNRDIFRLLSDVAGEEQEKEEHSKEEQGSGFKILFEGDNDEMLNTGPVYPDDEDNTKWLLANKQSSSKSYRQKQEQLYTKWANIHEQLGWELLCFQAVDPKGNTQELPPCMCPGRISKKVECISLEGMLL